MAATDLHFALPSENLALEAVVTSTPVLYVDEGVELLTDLDPATALRFAGAGPATWAILFDWSAYAAFTPVQWVVLAGTNWWQTAGNTRDVIVQINSVDSWGAPPFHLPMTLPAIGGGFRVGFAMDLSAVAGYLATHRYMRLVFVDSAAGVAPIVGETWLAAARYDVTPLGLGWNQDPDYPGVVHETPAFHRIAYSKDVRRMTMKGRNFYTDTEYALLATLAADARGEVRPFPVQCDPDDEPLLVNLMEFKQSRSAPDTHDVSLEFLECVNDLVP